MNQSNKTSRLQTDTHEQSTSALNDKHQGFLSAPSHELEHNIAQHSWWRSMISKEADKRIKSDECMQAIVPGEPYCIVFTM